MTRGNMTGSPVFTYESRVSGGVLAVLMYVWLVLCCSFVVVVVDDAKELPCNVSRFR